MKRTLLLLLSLTGSSLGQGEINGINYNPSQNVNGQVYRADGTLAESEVMSQLYVAPHGGSLAPVGSPKAFVGNGVVSFGTVTVPGIPAGGQADVQLRSWTGPCWPFIPDDCSEYGESNVITITLSGGLNPPAYLTGLQPTQMYLVPEPSTWALMTLGFGMLVFRRSR